jgi:integrase
MAFKYTRVSKQELDDQASEGFQTIPTLATLLDKLDATGLPEAQLVGLRSAVRSAARLLNAQPPHLPAELRTLLAKLHRVSPGPSGISRKRRQNISAELKRAFEVVGWRQRQNKGSLTPAWRRLFEALPDKFSRCSLTRFFRFCCSEQDIEPDQVDDAVLTAFRGYLDEIDFCREPATMHRDVARVWNQMSAQVEGWPSATLILPRSDRFWALRWTELPASLRADTEAWLAQNAADDPFDDQAPMTPLKPATIKARDQQIRMFASALVQSGQDPASLRSIADLLVPSAFKVGMKQLLDRAKDGAKTQPGAIGQCLLAAAKYWVHLPKTEVEAMRRVVGRVRDRQRGMTEKNKMILRQLDNPTCRRNLLDFPRQVLEDVRRRTEVSRAAALLVQSALATEVLIKTAIRRANLASIHLDRHLRFIRTRHTTTVHLVFEGHEVKNGQDLAFELSGETVRLLQAYLDDYRPTLVTGDNRFLFPGRGSTPKAAHRLSSQLTKHVYDRTGITLTAHSFRHIAAKLLLEDNAVNYEGARQLLGHTSLKTTTEFYCGEERAAHLRRYDAIVERQRGGGVGEPPSRTGTARRRGDQR